MNNDNNINNNNNDNIGVGLELTSKYFLTEQLSSFLGNLKKGKIAVKRDPPSSMGE